MKVQRDRVRTARFSEDDEEGYAKGEPGDLFEMVWELTCDAWAFRSGERAERRLQRDVTHLVKRRS